VRPRDFQKLSAKVTSFLTAFYSPFGLELLSIIDYIITTNQAESFEEIKGYLWSDRKRTLSDNEKFIEIAVDRIPQFHNQKSPKREMLSLACGQ
jgi:hypothetical protein